jgi:hypothetical protein
MSDLDELCDEQGLEVLKMDGYDECVVGTVSRCGMSPVLCYDVEKVLENLQRQGMTRDEAEEFFEFNQAGAWMGDGTPCFLSLFEELELNKVAPAPVINPMTLEELEAWRKEHGPYVEEELDDDDGNRYWSEIYRVDGHLFRLSGCNRAYSEVWADDKGYIRGLYQPKEVIKEISTVEHKEYRDVEVEVSYQSCAQWPEGTLNGNNDDITRDTNGPMRAAWCVCKRLESDGFGGDGKVFPTKTWIEVVRETKDE